MIPTKGLVFRFSDVEVSEPELRAMRAGQALEIEPKAFRVLVHLIKNSGHLVSKSELMDAVWGETAVTENSLARAIALLRRVLEDDPRQPRFIETVSTAGYRFICPVQTERPPDNSSKSAEVAEVLPNLERPQQDAMVPAHASKEVKPQSWLRRRRWVWIAGTVVLAFTGIGAAWWVWWFTPAVPHVTSTEAITRDGIGKVFPVTDGSRIYFSEVVKERESLAQVSVTGGEVSNLATPFPTNALRDIAPDKSSLLVSEYRFNEPLPLWIVPLPSGAPRRVGNLLANDAAWTPDGTQIVFSKGTEIWKTNADGSQARKLLTTPGLPYTLRVSPDGKRMRFSVSEQLGGPANTLWEAATDGSGAHRLLPGWQEQPTQNAGGWSPDGRFYVFGCWTQQGEDLWIMADHPEWLSHRRSVPVQLTRGPKSFGGPIAFSADGRTLFVEGWEQHMELMRFDPAKHLTAPYLSRLSATEASFSRDGQWVTYVTLPDSSLWRSRTDGSDRLQLTSPPGGADIPRWSPDGRRIALDWTVPGKQTKLAVISRDGGTPEQVIPDSEDSRDQEDPTWSPDGEQIIFARDITLAAVERLELLRVDLRTKKVTPVPGSEGLFSPRWSPDGHYLAAFSVDARSIHLFDFQKQTWTTWFRTTQFTPEQGHVRWVGTNLWSQDSKTLYFSTNKDDNVAYWRIGVGSQSPTKVADLIDESFLGGTEWPTLTPDGGVLYTRDLSTYEIYALHLSEK